MDIDFLIQHITDAMAAEWYNTKPRDECVHRIILQIYTNRGLPQHTSLQTLHDYIEKLIKARIAKNPQIKGMHTF